MHPGPAHHPVWSVYDEQRTARLNVRYLQRELARLKFVDRWSEILVAVATTSSVGSFWVLQTLIGGAIWKTAGAIAVVVSIVRPILRLSDRIQEKEKLLTGYSVLDHDLHCICIEIRHARKYDNSLHKEFVSAMNRKAELIKTNSASPVDEKLLKKCEALVILELPAESFFIPES